MKFRSSVVSCVLLAATSSWSTSSIHAFTIPQPNHVVTTKSTTTTTNKSDPSSLIVPSSTLSKHGLILPEQYQLSSSSLLRMVAGGAERAYQDEYYEGMRMVHIYISCF